MDVNLIKPPKYTGRKFANPFSKKIGRRTGRDVLAGKKVRVNEEGLQNFDDYLSESDLDVTRERVLMHSIHEERESQLSDDSAKENAASRDNVSVSQSVPNKSALDSRLSKNGPNQSTLSLSHSQLSQGSKVNNRSRFGWLRNKNIGRRTGKDVVAGKQIRRDEEGLEIFDDYLSPSSGTESFLSHSSVNSQRRSKGRPESTTTAHEDDTVSGNSGNSQSSTEAVHDDKHDVRSDSDSETEQKDRTGVGVDRDSEGKNDSEDEEKIDNHEKSEYDKVGAGSAKKGETENSDVENGDVVDSKGLENEHENENVEEISEHENGEHSENSNNSEEDTVKAVEAIEKQRNKKESENQTSNKSKAAGVYDFEREFKNFVGDSQKSRTSVGTGNRKSANKSLKTSRHSEVDSHSHGESNSEDEQESITKSNTKLTRRKGANVSHRSSAGTGKLRSKLQTEGDVEKDTSNEEHALDKSRSNRSQVSKKSLSRNESNTSKRSIQDESESVSNKSFKDRKQSTRTGKDKQKLETNAQTVQNDNLGNADDDHDNNDDEKQSDHHDADESDEDTNVEDDQYDDERTEKDRSQTLQMDRQADEQQNEELQSDEEEEEEEIEYDDAENDIRPSQTGIDVAGNRSGSITKLEAPDTSKVSFDRTRKRLSYSALEMSDESKKARISRVKEANQSLQERSSKSMKSSISSRLSTSLENTGHLKTITSNKNKKSIPDKVDQMVDGNKDEDVTGQTNERTRIASEYNEPGDFVSLASVARRRSTFVARKYGSDDDSIDIIDEFSTKKKRKSVRSKKSVTNAKRQENAGESDAGVVNTRKSKSTMKSKTRKSSARKMDVDEAEDVNDGITANVSKNKSKGFIMAEQPRDDDSVEEIYRRNIDNILNDVESHQDSEIEIVEDLPKQGRGRKSSNLNKADTGKSVIQDHENVVETVEDITMNKNKKNKSIAKKQSSKSSTKTSKSEDVETKVSRTKAKTSDSKSSTGTDQSKKSRKVSVLKATKSSRSDNQNVTENNCQEDIDNDVDLQLEENALVPDNHANDPYDLNDDDSENVDLYIEDDNAFGDNIVVESDKIAEKNTRVSRQKASEYKSRTKQTKSDKTKALKSKQPKDTNSKAGTRRKLPSQSSIRSSRLKSGNSQSNRNKQLHHGIKRKKTAVLEEIEIEETESHSESKKNKVSDPDSYTDTEQQLSAKRKLEFKQQQAVLDKRRHKSLGVGGHQGRLGKSSGTPRRKSYHDKVGDMSTPAVNSLLNVPTNFNSGISIRVSRRTELLDQIGSGYGNVPNVSVQENQPADNLTPCISKGGKSRKSKGHRVSICPVEKTVFSDGLNSSSDIDVRKKSRTRLSSLGTPLPSLSSSPKHFFEQSRPGTPKPGRKSGEYIKSRLIVPEPAPDGLRRSKRNRLPPVAWCRGEKIVYARKNAYDWVILGVKESNEVRYRKMEEEKRKRRKMMNEIRKATRKEQHDFTKRKLSIHVELPDDAHPLDTSEVSVPEAFSAETMMINCIAKADSRSPVGPHHGKPTKEDPYLIKKLIDQPLMSMGQLTIKPEAEKPPQIVDNAATTFMIHYGKVLVTVHNTTSLLETGDVFFVPFGCAYSIKNLRHDSAQLYYTLIKVIEDPEQEHNE